MSLYTTDSIPTKTPTIITRNHLTFQERVALLDDMKKVVQVHSDGRCAYVDGWSDERVAKEFMDGKATVLNVSLMRKKCFGRLVEYSKVRNPTTAARMSKLELRIERLEEMIRLRLR